MGEESEEQRFAGKLRAAMEDADISNAELARAVGVSEETVSRWRSGLRRPAWRRLKKLAAFFGKTPEHFAGEPEVRRAILVMPFQPDARSAIRRLSDEDVWAGFGIYAIELKDRVTERARPDADR